MGDNLFIHVDQTISKSAHATNRHRILQTRQSDCQSNANSKSSGNKAEKGSVVNGREQRTACGIRNAGECETKNAARSNEASERNERLSNIALTIIIMIFLFKGRSSFIDLTPHVVP